MPSARAASQRLLNGQGRRERRHPRVRVSPYREGAAASGIASDHDVEGGLQDRLDSGAVEQGGPSGRQGAGKDVALATGKRLDALALLDIAQQEEVPRLAQAHAGCLMGRAKDAQESCVIDRIHREPSPYIATQGNGVIDSRTALGSKGVCIHHKISSLGQGGPVMG